MNESHYTYAGFWLRAVAFIIDGVVVAIPAVILGALFSAILPAILRPDSVETILEISTLLLYVSYFLIFWLYFTKMESSKRQATYGKKWLGLKVTDMNGQRISFGRANKRFWAKFLSGLILNIGFMMAGFTAQKQALHDMIAKTLVLKK